MNKIVGTLLAAGGLLAIAGTSQAQVNLTAETASPGGAPHLSITFLASTLDEAGIAKLQVTEGATLTNSVLSVAEGNLDMSAAPLILTFLLERGAGPYSSLGAETGAGLQKNLRALYFYNAGHFALAHYNTSNVQGWDDISGKSIHNGPPRGAALTDSRAIIELATGLKDGEGYTGVQVPWPQANDVFTSGRVEASVVPHLVPSGRATFYSSAGGLTMHSIPKDRFESDLGKRITTAPGRAPYVIPMSEMEAAYQGTDITVISEDDTFRSFVSMFAQIVTKDMDFDLAKAITKNFLDTVDQLNEAAPFARSARFSAGNLVGPEQGVCGPVTIKMHPGAIAAYEEAGFSVDPCLKE